MDRNRKNILAWTLAAFLLYLAVRYLSTVEGFLRGLLAAARPVFIGIFLAFIVNIPMTFFEEKVFGKLKKGRRAVSLLVSYVMMILIFTVLMIVIVPKLMESIGLLFETIPQFIEDLIDMIDEGLDGKADEIVLSLNEGWANVVKSLKSKGGEFFHIALGIFSSAFSFLVTLFLSIVFSIYMLAEKDRLRRGTERLLDAYMKKPWGEYAMHIAHTVNQVFRKFIVGQSTEAVILGSLAACGMMMLGLPFGPSIGALIGVTALIPIMGAWIGAIVGVIMIFPISPVKSLVFLIFLVILQQAENNLIYPRVVGTSIGLPGLWVLLAITVGGGVGGVLGMLLAVPTVASVFILINENVEKREAKKGKTEVTSGHLPEA